MGLRREKHWSTTGHGMFTGAAPAMAMFNLLIIGEEWTLAWDSKGLHPEKSTRIQNSLTALRAVHAVSLVNTVAPGMAMLMATPPACRDTVTSRD
jgi:hypothetical protein